MLAFVVYVSVNLSLCHLSFHVILTFVLSFESYVILDISMVGFVEGSRVLSEALHQPEKHCQQAKETSTSQLNAPLM